MAQEKTFEEVFEDAKSRIWFGASTNDEVVERFAELISLARSIHHYRRLQIILSFKKMAPFRAKVLEAYKILQCQRCLKARLT